MRWRFLLWRFRFVLASCCLAGAIYAGLSFWAAQIRPGSPLVVLARPVTAGAKLTSSDLTVHPVPPALAVAGTGADPAAFIGQRLRVGLPAGALVFPQVLASSGLRSDLPPGFSAISVSLAAHTAPEFLQPGGRVEIFGSATDAGAGMEAGTVRLCSEAIVLAAPTVAADSWLSAGATGVISAQIAVPAHLAGQVLGANTRGPLLLGISPVSPAVGR